MKFSIWAGVVGLLITSQAFADGGQRGRPDRDSSERLLTRGTQAWFAAESMENTLKGLIQASELDNRTITSAAVELKSAVESHVDLVAGDFMSSSICQMIEESSNHGTVMKKEVICNQLPESRIRIEKSSVAGKVVESLEHSLRLAIKADSAYLTTLIKSSLVLGEDSKIAVELVTSTGLSSKYLCGQIDDNRGLEDSNGFDCRLAQ